MVGGRASARSRRAGPARQGLRRRWPGAGCRREGEDAHHVGPRVGGWRRLAGGGWRRIRAPGSRARRARRRCRCAEQHAARLSLNWLAARSMLRTAARVARQAADLRQRVLRDVAGGGLQRFADRLHIVPDLVDRAAAGRWGWRAARPWRVAARVALRFSATCGSCCAAGSMVRAVRVTSAALCTERIASISSRRLSAGTCC